jgi:methylmalonyl-CoA/ethylmalonyl-CoA epimerase
MFSGMFGDNTNHQHLFNREFLLMSQIKKVNHIAILVENIENALEFWQDQLGLTLDHIEDVPSQASKVAFLPVGEGEVELVEPTDPESGLAKYLEKRGEGMHHLCFQVDDIEAMLDLLKAKDVRLINESPVDLPGRRMAFIHPKAANGVLIELYEIIE